MDAAKIIGIVEMYEGNLRVAKIPKVRMDPGRTFRSLTKEEILAHAHFLCDGVKQFAQDPEHEGKANRHLTAIQMCLSFAGWYTLENLMNHNRP